MNSTASSNAGAVQTNQQAFLPSITSPNSPLVGSDSAGSTEHNIGTITGQPNLTGDFPEALYPTRSRFDTEKTMKVV